VSNFPRVVTWSEVARTQTCDLSIASPRPSHHHAIIETKTTKTFSSALKTVVSWNSCVSELQASVVAKFVRFISTGIPAA